MKRALIIHPSDGDYETSALVRAIARDTDGGADFVSVGPGGLFRDWLSCARHVRSRKPAVIHAISSRALRAAVANGAAPILFTPLGRVCTGDKLIRGLRDVTVVVQSAAWRSKLEPAFGRTHVMPSPLIQWRHPVSAHTRDADARAQFRARLGINENDLVIVAPGESTRHADHRLAVWVAIILHVLDARCRLVLWGRGPQADAVERFAFGLKFGAFTVAVEPTLGTEVGHGQVLNCADVVLDTSTELGGGFAVAEAIAMGLPTLLSQRSAGVEIVARRRSDSASRFDHVHVCASSKARALATDLMALIRAPRTSRSDKDPVSEPAPMNRVVGWTDFYDCAARGLPLPNPI
jgi:glycosyltransferase involved in cell wall biosynthesis